MRRPRPRPAAAAVAAWIVLIGCGSARTVSRGERALAAVDDGFGGALAAGTLAGVVFEGVVPGMDAAGAAASAPARFHAAASSTCAGAPVEVAGARVRYVLRDCIVAGWGRISGTFDATWEDTPDGLRARIVAEREVWQLEAPSAWVEHLAARRARAGDPELAIEVRARIGWGPAGERGRTLVEGSFAFGPGRELRGRVDVTTGELAGTVTLDYRRDPQTGCPLDGQIEARIAGLTIVRRWRRNTGPEYRPSYTLDISDGTHREALVDCRWGSAIGPR